MQSPSVAISLCVSILVLACGGEDSAPGSADADGVEGPCGFEDRYLPHQAGYSWSYRVTNLGTPEVVVKSQSLVAQNDPVLGDVLVQTTAKDNGTTVSMFKRQGEAVLRLRQEDRDLANLLERTTLYDPGQVRIDEASDRIVLGAAWDEIYNVVVTDAAGIEVSNGITTDHWEVLGVDVDCSSPLGTFSCLHLRRQRTAGGISDKQFFFAKGVGKVKEVNANQVEELVSCQ